MLDAANVPLLGLLAQPAHMHVLNHPLAQRVVFSSFIETSCLTGGKTHIVSPERPHTKSNAELGTERQPQAPIRGAA